MPFNCFQKFFAIVSFLTLFICASVAPLLSQQAGQEAPPPTIRVNTRLVLVDVVVRDRQSKPVTDLKAQDFTVQEKGKAQKIAFFIIPGQSKEEAQLLPPGIYSNRPEYRSPGGPLTVLLLDAANTPFRDQAYARWQMLKFVRDLKPGQKMAILTLTNSLGVLQDFTSDPVVLAKALQQFIPQEQEMTKGAAPPVIHPALNAHGGETGSSDVVNLQLRAFQEVQLAYVLDRRTEVTLAAMRSLARMLGGIPGRKSVIWVTAAFPFSLIPEDREITAEELAESLPSQAQLGLGTRATGAVAGAQRLENGPAIREAAAALSSAQISIYPVDARGLVSGMEATIDTAPASQLESISDAAKLTMSSVTASQETMREMARETGGKAYVNENEIKDGIALAMADNSAAYTIGYYPEDKKWDGKYRSIKVKIDRDGLEVRNRRGYFAVDPNQIKDRKPEQEVAEALRDNVPATGVTFRSQVKPTASGKLGVVFLVDAGTVSAEDASGGNKKLNIIFYASVFSADGRMLGNQSMKVDQAFNAETFQKIMQQGILMQMEMDPQPAGSEVRLAVQDKRTGSVGTVTIPLKP